MKFHLAILAHTQSNALLFQPLEACIDAGMARRRIVRGMHQDELIQSRGFYLTGLSGVRTFNCLDNWMNTVRIQRASTTGRHGHLHPEHMRTVIIPVNAAHGRLHGGCFYSLACSRLFQAALQSDWRREVCFRPLIVLSLRFTIKPTPPNLALGV